MFSAGKERDCGVTSSTTASTSFHAEASAHSHRDFVARVHTCLWLITLALALPSLKCRNHRQLRSSHIMLGVGALHTR
jgi:hypothetical protein